MGSHYPDIVCDDTPQNFGLKMFPPFPRAAAKVVPPFDVGDNSFHAATPLFQPCFHIFAAGNIPKATNNLIEHDIDYPFSLAWAWFANEAYPPSVA